MKRRLFLTGCLLASLAGFLACDNSDDPQPEPGQEKWKVLVETTIKNPDGTSGSSYIQLLPDFSKQSIDNKNSIQVGFDAGIRVDGNHIFVCPEFGKDGTQEVMRYTYDGSQKLSGPASLALPPMSGAFSLTVVDGKAYVPFYNLGKVWIFDPETMVKTGEIDLTTYAHGDNSPDPASMLARDGLLYITLDQIGPNWMPYPEYKQSDVAIVDIKTNQVVKVISEKSSGLTFPTRPHLYNMIFTDEANDIYIGCAGGFGLDPRFPESGFLCIRSGETEFDPTASWDITRTTIDGTSYKPGSLSNCKYIGDGKLCAYVSINELMAENPYSAKYSMAVLIDLKAKSIRKIDGLPLSDGHSIFMDKLGDQVVIASYGEKVAGFFTYDPKTGSVSDGPVITTTGNPIFVHAFE